MSKSVSIGPYKLVLSITVPQKKYHTEPTDLLVCDGKIHGSHSWSVNNVPA